MSSVVVVPYSGGWDDLGTWDTLTSKIDTSILGRGHLCDKSKNTHIINQLNVPVLGIGLSNIVVVVNEAGVLVCEKERSAYLKEYIKKL